MSSIKYKNETLNFEMDCVKFIKVPDMLTFYSKLCNKEFEIYDEHSFINDRNLIILPTTRWADLFNFTKSNILTKYVVEEANTDKFKLINDFELNKLKEYFNRLFNSTEINLDVDLFKLIPLLLDFDTERLICKRDLLTLITMLHEKSPETKIILFNSDWLDKEAIEAINSHNIKTLIIYNEPMLLNELILNNLHDILIFKNDKFTLWNKNENINEDVNSNIEKVFIKV